MGAWDWGNFTAEADQWGTQLGGWGGYFDPTNPMGQNYMNPYTQQTYAYTPEQWGELQKQQNFVDYNVWDADPFSDFMRPGQYRGVNIGGQEFMGYDENHDFNINPDALAGLFGGGSGMLGTGGGGYSVSGAPDWSYTAPDAWSAYEFDLGKIDPTAAIEAYQPYIQERRDKAFAQTNADMAPVMRGMVAGSPYAKAAAGVERHAQEDYDRIAQEYMFKASTENARNQLQAEIAQQQAYEQQMAMMAQFQHQQQLAMNAHNLGGWGTEQGLGMQNFWNQQNMTLQQQQQQMQAMMQMMGMFGPG
jgi:hypothetical protein